MVPQMSGIISVILIMIFELLVVTLLVKMHILNMLVELLLMVFEPCLLVPIFWFDSGLMRSIISCGFKILSLGIIKTNNPLKFMWTRKTTLLILGHLAVAVGSDLLVDANANLRNLLG